MGGGPQVMVLKQVVCAAAGAAIATTAATLQSRHKLNVFVELIEEGKEFIL